MRELATDRLHHEDASLTDCLRIDHGAVGGDGFFRGKREHRGAVFRRKIRVGEDAFECRNECAVHVGLNAVFNHVDDFVQNGKHQTLEGVRAVKTVGVV